MTDIARKRIYTESTKVPNGPTHKNVQHKKAKIEGKKVEESKVVPDAPTEESRNEDDFFACEGTLSLFSVGEKTPSLLKKKVDEVLEDKSQTSFLKTIFLYFFELMGVDRSDETTIGLLFEHILKAHSNVGHPKEMKASTQEQLKINYEEVVFMSGAKNNVQNLRTFKRCIKLIVTGLVD
jgi:hypothetical protein